MKIKKSFLLFPFFVSSVCISQSPLQKVNQFRKENEAKIIDEYLKFVSIPNVTRDTANILRNAALIKQMMELRGIKTEFLTGTTPNVNPAVYGEVIVPGAKTTLAFYAHYDGQPVNPSRWTGGLKPFEPVFIDKPIEQGGKIIQNPGVISPEWRITGRGSADDKAGVMTIINAYDALVKSNIPLKHNLKFFFEGEEELGSAHLDEIFIKNKEKLLADLWIISDGPRHVSGRKMVVFGVRGDVNMNLTVYGAKRPLHSGNYGNWAPNPAKLLVDLLAGMKDENGNVLVEGYYDDVVPLSAVEKEAIANVPDIEEQLKKELGIAVPEGGGKSFLELLHLPTLNINGIKSADVGELAANIIPAIAEATLDLRLVLGNEMDSQINKVIRHIQSKGFHVTDHEPTDEERLKYGKLIKITHGDGYVAQRTSFDIPVVKSMIKAIQATVNYPVILFPTAGGSLPLFLFEKLLGATLISVPVVNYDNNQHAENENVQISFLWEGIETMAVIMVMDHKK
ncbi:MAG TPA: M20/M25/M40 family metallo-hydrolase [Chitinophagaceae bacterium]|nr:M20/M25/M40 family metallo-hydrolase [Chitinophagaceae bacterium]